MTLTIQTLGGLSSDPEAPGLLSRSKRLALLLYLVIDHPGRLHTRDHLVSVFWPESDARRARNCLRQSLHVLRSVADGVHTVGRHEVGIDPDRIHCDVLDFEWEARRCAWRSALHLYRGPLLPGFHCRGAPGFMVWLQQRRDALRRIAGRCAQEEARASQARGRSRTALRWYRRAADLSPYDEGVHRALVRAHLVVGDRTGAAAAHRVFAERMRRELGVDPASLEVDLGAS